MKKVKKLGLGGFLDDAASRVSSGIDAAVNTAGNVIRDPGGAIDYAANAAGNVVRDPVGFAERTGRYYAEDPTRAIPMAAMALMKKGGKVSSASKRADGIAQRGKTRGKIC